MQMNYCCTFSFHLISSLHHLSSTPTQLNFKGLCGCTGISGTERVEWLISRKLNKAKLCHYKCIFCWCFANGISSAPFANRPTDPPGLVSQSGTTIIASASASFFFFQTAAPVERQDVMTTKRGQQKQRGGRRRTSANVDVKASPRHTTRGGTSGIAHYTPWTPITIRIICNLAVETWKVKENGISCCSTARPSSSVPCQSWAKDIGVAIN